MPDIYLIESDIRRFFIDCIKHGEAFVHYNFIICMARSMIEYNETIKG